MVSFLCLVEPLNPSAPISWEFEKKLSFMASMGEMPDMAGYIISFCTSHFGVYSLNRVVLGGKPADYDRFKDVSIPLFS